MNIMCLIIFEEKAEIQDQYPLSLNRDRDRLQKYWANIDEISILMFSVVICAEVIYPPFIKWRSLDKKGIDYLSIKQKLVHPKNLMKKAIKNSIFSNDD